MSRPTIAVGVITRGLIENTLSYTWLSKLPSDVTVFTHGNNHSPISIRYNRFIELAKQKQIDFLYLVHDDVAIPSVDMLQNEKLLNAFDVWGVAGSKDVTIKHPTLWHLMSKQLHGFAGHFVNDKQVSMTNFGPTPNAVDMFDGVFMCININKLPDSIRFRAPGFHHYDIDFSLQCSKAGMSVGVVPFPIYHKSPGLLSINDEKWKASEKWFLDTWSVSNK